MANWRTAPICYVEDEVCVLDDRGAPLAAVNRRPWRDFAIALFGRNRSRVYEVTDPSGAVLFRFVYKRGDFRSWLRLTRPDGTPLATADRVGTTFTPAARRLAEERQSTTASVIVMPPPS